MNKPQPLRLRFSVSKLEQFRKFLDYTEDDHFEVTKESVIDSIKGVFRKTPEMDFGTAYHSLIENKPGIVRQDEKGFHTLMEDGTFYFIPNHLASPGITYRQSHPGAVFEVPGQRSYEYSGYTATVTKRIDVLEALITRDIKTTRRPPKYEDWMKSYQWRFYLLTVGGTEFRYDFFKLKEKTLKGVKYVDSVSYEEMRMQAYPGMDHDCIYLVRNFVEFCKLNNLMEFIIDKKYADRELA